MIIVEIFARSGASRGLSGVAGVVRSSPRNVICGDRDLVLETSKLPNSAGDRRFESVSLQR
jgi:hypothetical protein